MNSQAELSHVLWLLNGEDMEELTFKERPVDSTRILYTPSAFAKSSLLYLQETGELYARIAHTNQRSDLASYLFFIVLSGKGALTYADERHALTPGDCVFIDCRKPYAHSTDQDLWVLKWVHFNGPAMQGVYQKYMDRGGKCVFHAEDAGPYTSLLSALYGVAISPDYVRDMRINELLSRLLVLLMEAGWSESRDQKSVYERHTLLDVKDFLTENFQKTIALDELAEMFYLNKFYLARIFKARYGSSILNFIIALRVSHAKRLLRFSGLSIGEIGEACGMPDGNYFSRVFRKAEGMSPSEYRKQW